MSIEDNLAEIRTQLVSYETDIAKVKDELEFLNKEKTALENERTDLKKSLIEFSKLCGEEKKKLEEVVKVMETESDRLTTEVELLVRRKGDLTLANEQLQSQNKHFREYEAKAIKVLRTTEDSLIQREKAIQQKEQFKSDKSILPPLN